MLATQLQAAGGIVRNGAGRIFEFGAFCHGTGDLSRAIEDHPAFNIAGGGNTLAAICRNGMEDRIDNNSTGAVPSSACAKARRCRTSRS
jgi:phosphoglycerate kinase